VSTMEDAGSVMRACREIMERNSKSFALAARLLPLTSRDRAASVYAFCRRVDDAIDDAPHADQARALAVLHDELDAIYAAKIFRDPSLRAFQAVVKTCHVPPRYPRELIEGMAMDVLGTRYETLDDLLLYCHRVAGVVGLMMCHVFGVTRDDALEQAAQLGIAMQLTNICRDVAEDWQLGRLYLPRELLQKAGAREGLDPSSQAFPTDEATLTAMQRVMRILLDEADSYYVSAAHGVTALPFRAGLAVRAAHVLYRAIGVEVAARAYDPTRGRAVVSRTKKLELVARALVMHLANLPAFALERLEHGRARSPQRELSFPSEVLGPRPPLLRLVPMQRD